MAKYTKVWENGIETSTLYFRGREFTLTMGDWDGDGSCISKELAFEYQMEEAFKDDEDIEEILDALDLLDDDFEREEALEILSGFE